MRFVCLVALFVCFGVCSDAEDFDLRDSRYAVAEVGSINVVVSEV